MRLNLPVTQREHPLREGQTLVSTTDVQGRITHCNAAFIEASGYELHELLGEPHSIVRHPDVPAAAFKDMWSTIGRGRPWSAVVKNRRKNGDHYWVRANVTPVMQGGKPVSYMSVRTKPSAEEIRQAEALYAQLGAGKTSPLRLHAGGLRRNGMVDWPNRIYRLTLTQRMALALSLIGLLAAAVPASGVFGAATAWVTAAALGAGALGLLLWFHRTISVRVDACSDLAGRIAGCELGGDPPGYDMRHPLGQLMRQIWLANLNMRAIVDDVRSEVDGVTDAAREIAEGSAELSRRTEQQSESIQHTAAAMEQIHGTVHSSAQAAQLVERTADRAGEVATRGGDEVETVVAAMQAIEATSKRVAEVIQIIEGMAFQTNILSLNAAVEAARAGEQGRGFAVVASNVRGLAHSSSESAREIKGLIASSVEGIHGGVERVSSAAKVIREVVQSVEEVGRLVREISRAAAEQQQGVASVNQAVNQIDQATQHNAALAGQTSTACQALHRRADTLVRAVQIFSTRAPAQPAPG